MKLMTKELEAMIPRLYETECSENKKAIIKYFNPCGSATWYAMEYCPEEKIFFGYVDLYGDGMGEYGYFSLEELESITLPFGLKIERDLYFTPTNIEDIIQ